MDELPFLRLKPLPEMVHHRWKKQITFAQTPPIVQKPILGKNSMHSCDPKVDRYHATCNEAFTRVLCYNHWDTSVRGPLPDNGSLLGPHGHLERACAWSHLFGAGLFAFYAVFVRPQIADLEMTSFAGKASLASSFVLVLTYLVSAMYHIYNTVPNVAWFVRMLDHHFIVIAMTTAAFADAAIATKDFNQAPWQTSSDGIIAGSAVIIFFAYRRLVIPADETRLGWGDCNLGLWRTCHSDLEHGSLRVATYMVMSSQFLLNIPAISFNLQNDAVAPYLVTVLVGFVLMVAGMMWDHLVVYPDDLYGSAYEMSCHSKSWGCIMTSHAWWHVTSLAATIVVTIGREVTIANQHDHPTLVEKYEWLKIS